MINLLEETIEDMAKKWKQPSDVLWVGSRDGMLALSWEDFKATADFTYDCGYGGQEIASDLVVVGVDWWLERSEYDGSEGWEFKVSPVLKPNHKPFKHLTSNASWATLEEHAKRVEENEDD